MHREHPFSPTALTLPPKPCASWDFWRSKFAYFSSWSQICSTPYEKIHGRTLKTVPLYFTFPSTMLQKNSDCSESWKPTLHLPSRIVMSFNPVALSECLFFFDRVFVLFIFHHGVHWTYKCFAYVAPRGWILVRRGLCGFGDIRGSVGRYDPWGIKADPRSLMCKGFSKWFRLKFVAVPTGLTNTGLTAVPPIACACAIAAAINAWSTVGCTNGVG